jgi:hypothetical protein
VESNGRGTDGQRGSEGADNVVRFTGDWFGPPEQLIPIGPAALRAVDEPPLEAPDVLGPDAFWGEESASLHEAIQGPVRPVEDRQSADGESQVASRGVVGCDRRERSR